MNTSFRFTLVALLLAFFASGYAQSVNKWQDIHQVKKKETIFGIARDYGITVNELIQANPEMNAPGYELKKGDYIRIPYPSQNNSADNQNTNISASSVTPNAPSSSAPSSKTVRVGVMLPLHNVDGDGRRMIEYYRGLLLACDSLKHRGISVDVHAWNVPIDADIRQTLLAPAASKCDIIFGPLYTRQMKYLSDFARTYNIKLVIPFSISGDDVQNNPQIFQVYQTPSSLEQQAVDQFVNRFAGHHAVFVDCHDSTSTKGTFTSALRRQLDSRGIQYSITSLRSSDDAFARAFSRTQPNVVVLNTGRSPQLNSTFARLNRLTEMVPSLAISMYGYNEWLMYVKPYTDLYYRYDTYIPSWYYRDPQSPLTWRLESKYRHMFGTDMQYALPRFALTGFDQAYFFIKGIHDHGRAFNGTRAESDYQPTQTPFHFQRVGQGGMQNRQFMLIHYTPSRTIVKTE